MAGGRDQIGPLERLIKILVTLEESEPKGLTTEDLIEIAGYGSTRDPERQLNRDITALKKIGWDIRNAAERGTAGRFRLHARDTRLRVELAPKHQVQLVRAALAAGAPDFVDRLGDDLFEAEPGADASFVRASEPHRPGHDALDKAAYATDNRCLVRFVYKQTPRVVHPHLVHPGASGWYLVGHEDGSSTVKRFVTDRMADVVVDRPDTAVVPEDAMYDELNPITWEVDPPTDVVVETSVEHEPHVVTMLGTPVRREVIDDDAQRRRGARNDGETDDGRTIDDGEASDDDCARGDSDGARSSDDGPEGETVVLTIPVTHRAAFRARLYELDRRVRVLGPDDVRAEIIAELERFVQRQPLL